MILKEIAQGALGCQGWGAKDGQSHGKSSIGLFWVVDTRPDPPGKETMVFFHGIDRPA